MPTFVVSVYCSINCRICAEYFISFIGLDCVLPSSLFFTSPIVIVCQPSSYHCTEFSFIGFDCVLPWRLSLPSPIVIVWEPSSYHCTNFSFVGLDCVLPSSYHCTYNISFIGLDCILHIEAFPSLHQLWLYTSLHHIIAQNSDVLVLIVVFTLKPFLHQSWLYGNLRRIIAQTFPSLVLIVFYLHHIITYTTFSSLVLIVFYTLKSFLPFINRECIANLYHIIAHIGLS